MKRAARSPARSRPRKKAVAPESASSAEAVEPETPSDGRNVDPLEGSLSVVAGVLFLVMAVFPRSLRQLLLLSVGGGLLYRGVTGHCHVYEALEIDTAKQPLLKL